MSKPTKVITVTQCLDCPAFQLEGCSYHENWNGHYLFAEQLTFGGEFPEGCDLWRHDIVLRMAQPRVTLRDHLCTVKAAIRGLPPFVRALCTVTGALVKQIRETENATATEGGPDNGPTSQTRRHWDRQQSKTRERSENDGNE